MSEEVKVIDSESEKRFYCETLINLIRVFPGGIDYNYDSGDNLVEESTHAILKPLRAAILHANEIGVSFLPFPVKTRFRNYLEVLNNNLSYHFFSETTRLFFIGAKKYPESTNNDLTALLNDAGKSLIVNRQMHEFLDECQRVLSTTRIISLDVRHKAIKDEYVIVSKASLLKPSARRKYVDDWERNI